MIVKIKAYRDLNKQEEAIVFQMAQMTPIHLLTDGP